jgi:hypothetical protein
MRHKLSPHLDVACSVVGQTSNAFRSFLRLEPYERLHVLRAFFS